MHAAEVEQRHAGIQAFEAGRLAEFNPALLDGFGYLRNVGAGGDFSVVRIGHVNAPGVGANEALLEGSQLVPVAHQTENDGFEAGGARVVLFVRIGRRQ